MTRLAAGLGGASVAVSDRLLGDVRPEVPGGPSRQVALAGAAWTTVHQVHGTEVVEVDRSRGAIAKDADALVTASADVPIAMFGADCALVAFSSDEGPIGVCHAGWKGLAAGVIEACADALRDLGATRLSAWTSPMIHPECYEFSPADLDALAAVLGEEVRAVTATGQPALDLPAGVLGALSRAGVDHAGSLGGCSACEGPWYSWRARREQERHGLVCWRPSAARRG